ncbi:MAG: efflux RND transporter periplasmic adaptor subunit [Candidatus Muirbacterium halophilum]|nr:efflux RND transporter periplasmic adaptor subunit [Candidatus Muirbacterium halophilum]
MKKKLALIILILIVISGIFIFLNRNNQETSFSVSGSVEMDKADISFRVPGIIQNIYFYEGQNVSKENTIISLDKDVYLLNHDISEIDLKLSEIKLKELKNGSRLEDIKKAQIEMNKSKINAETLESEFNRSKRLFNTKSISESNFDKIKNQFNIADSIFKQSQLNFELVKQGVRYEVIEYNEAIVKKAQKSLESAKLNLSYTELKAPFSGIISNIYCDTGENTIPGQTVVSIINPKNTWIRTYIPETMLSNISLGMEVKIKLDSVNDNVLIGNLSYISEEAEFTPKSVYTKEVRNKFVYNIKIRVNNENYMLKNGMPCSVIF